MRAILYHDIKDIRLEEIPIPTPKETEALVRIEWCGICGTDLHEVFERKQFVPIDKPHFCTGEIAPIGFGHEFAGTVISTPEGSDLKIGQAVYCDPRLFCFECGPCRDGHTNICQVQGFVGLCGAGGGFAEAVSRPVEQLHPLPENVPIDVAALVEPLSVAWHGIKDTNVTNWNHVTVLVVGGGPIGIAALFCLKALGAKKIIVAETTKKRHAFLQTICDVVLNPLEENVPNECRKRTDGRGVNVALDASGVEAALNDAMDALKWRGTYVNMAIADKPFQLPSAYIMWKELTFRSTLGYQTADIKDVIDSLGAGKMRGVEKMITSRIALEDTWEKGFLELWNHRADHVKIMVTPQKENLGNVQH